MCDANKLCVEFYFAVVSFVIAIYDKEILQMVLFS